MVLVGHISIPKIPILRLFLFKPFVMSTAADKSEILGSFGLKIFIQLSHKQTLVIM